MKNNKAPGEDKLNSKLYKYAENLFHRRLLKVLNSVWYDGTTP
jgi:hypothetical protein